MLTHTGTDLHTYLHAHTHAHAHTRHTHLCTHTEREAYTVPIHTHTGTDADTYTHSTTIQTEIGLVLHWLCSDDTLAVEKPSGTNWFTGLLILLLSQSQYIYINNIYILSLFLSLSPSDCLDIYVIIPYWFTVTTNIISYVCVVPEEGPQIKFYTYLPLFWSWSLIIINIMNN